MTQPMTRGECTAWHCVALRAVAALGPGLPDPDLSVHSLSCRAAGLVWWPGVARAAPLLVAVAGPGVVSSHDSAPSSPAAPPSRGGYRRGIA